MLNSFSDIVHLTSANHLRAVSLADRYLSYCKKSSHNPASLDASYLKAFFNQVKLKVETFQCVLCELKNSFVFYKNDLKQFYNMYN